MQAPTCQEKTKTLEQQIVDDSKQGGPVEVPFGVELIKYDGPLLRSAGVIVAISTRGFSVGEAPPTGDIYAPLVTARESAKAAPLLLFVDKDAPWSNVSKAAEQAVAAGYNKALFVFRSPKIPERPPSSIETTLQEMEQKAFQETGALSLEVMAGSYAKQMEKVLEKCPKAWEKVNNQPNATAWLDPIAVFQKSLLPELDACGCNADLDALRAIIFSIMRTTFKPLLSTVEISIAPSEDTKAILLSAPAQKTWAEAYTSIQNAKGGPFRLHIEGEPEGALPPPPPPPPAK